MVCVCVFILPDRCNQTCLKNQSINLLSIKEFDCCVDKDENSQPRERDCTSPSPLPLCCLSSSEVMCWQRCDSSSVRGGGWNAGFILAAFCSIFIYTVLELSFHWSAFRSDDFLHACWRGCEEIPSSCMSCASASSVLQKEALPSRARHGYTWYFHGTMVLPFIDGRLGWLSQGWHAVHSSVCLSSLPPFMRAGASAVLHIAIVERTG